RGHGPAEVCEKHGMTPMHHPGKNDPIDIGQNFLELLALLGWLRRQRGTNCTRFAVRRNAQRFYFSTIIRDPIRHSMKLFAENLRRSVSEFVVSILHSEITLKPRALATCHVNQRSVNRFSGLHSTSKTAEAVSIQASVDTPRRSAVLMRSCSCRRYRRQ